MHVTLVVVGLVVTSAVCAFMAAAARSSLESGVLVTVAVAFGYAAGYVRGRS